MSNTIKMQWRNMLPAATISTILGLPPGAIANERDETFSVTFAMMVRGKPVSGTVLCKQKVKCRLFDQGDPLLSLSVTREARNSYELDIRCGDCSFPGGRSRVYVTDDREFDIEYGNAGGVVTNLVVQHRERIGTLLLGFPSDDRWPR
ncbi:hypothetical protein [Rhizobium sp. 1399]|uniref:hypothetical protein n=1 Tax=Rhizobium sp. 1399 TaxID=2817758 RepID=UPI0028616EB5|nr:hypothetical protein [Rhizobium sp. 1399]MDR6670156.1 hypothetical protein [Rhizobium sp. 1399]